jgi:hypothetical protein
MPDKMILLSEEVLEKKINDAAQKYKNVMHAAVGLIAMPYDKKTRESLMGFLDSTIDGTAATIRSQLLHGGIDDGSEEY